MPQGVYDRTTYNSGWNNEWDNNPRFKKHVTIEAVIRMNKDGLTQSEIADHFGVSREVILNRFRKAGVKAINHRHKKGYYKTSAETKKKISKANKGVRKGKSWEEIFGKEKADHLKEFWRHNQRRKCLGSENPIYRPGAVEKMQKKAIARYKDPEYMRKVLTFNSPNKSEKFLLELLNKNKYKYKFVGDGSVVIDGKCPDFICEDKIIELFGERWHPPEDEDERKEFFGNRGYRTLVIWCKELKNIDKLLIKIEEFHNA